MTAVGALVDFDAFDIDLPTREGERIGSGAAFQVATATVPAGQRLRHGKSIARKRCSRIRFLLARARTSHWAGIRRPLATASVQREGISVRREPHARAASRSGGGGVFGKYSVNPSAASRYLQRKARKCRDSG